MSPRHVCVSLMHTLVPALACGCSFTHGPDVDRAATFDRFPLYWLGESFEGHELAAIEGVGESGPGVVLIYGECTPDGGLEPSCAPPVQVQIFPLCYHLDFPLCYHLDAVALRRRDGGQPFAGRRTAPPCS